MSGSRLEISRVKGAVQLREMVELSSVSVSDPTAERRPATQNCNGGVFLFHAIVLTL
jgi:hypothetical protein